MWHVFISIHNNKNITMIRKTAILIWLSIPCSTSFVQCFHDDFVTGCKFGVKISQYVQQTSAWTYVVTILWIIIYYHSYKLKPSIQQKRSLVSNSCDVKQGSRCSHGEHGSWGIFIWLVAALQTTALILDPTLGFRFRL